METTVEPTTQREPGRVRWFLGPLVEARTYLVTLDLLFDLPLGILWLSFFTTMVALGAGLLITLVGLPILTATFLVARWAARFERHRARLLLGLDVAEPPKPAIAQGSTLKSLVAPLRERTTWKELLYLWIVTPVTGIVGFTVAVCAWAVPLWAISLPMYALDSKAAAPELWSGERLDTPLEVIPVAVAGILLLPFVPRIVRGLAAVDAALVNACLGPSRRRALEERIDDLQESRARSVDLAISDRRQIERDLHDGAQQRLLALGMDLGMALEKFEDDPEAARKLVGGAHNELQRAIVELRNLARGIHPAVLTDRGLDAALSALAARSPVPVRLDVRVGERPPVAVEATAYFIVAEALTNAARYAEANAIDVRIHRANGTLRVEVVDDGVGGAQRRPGGGLDGLADRATSIEGTLTVTSPPGGPTTVVAELPCGS